MGCMCAICKCSPSTLQDLEQLNIFSKHPKLSLLIFDVCKEWLKQLQNLDLDRLTYNTPWSDSYILDRYGVSGEPYSWCRGDKFHTTLRVLLREIGSLIPLEYNRRVDSGILECMNPIYQSFKFSSLSKYVPDIKFLLFNKLLEIGQKYYPCKESTQLEIKSRDNNNRYRIRTQMPVSGENVLIRNLLRKPYIDDLLVDRYEWYVQDGYSHLGIGDLVLTNARGVYLVIEVKYLDLISTGHTARTSRTDKRNLVREQAYKYAEKFRESIAGQEALLVIPVTYTNEDKLLTFLINPIMEISNGNHFDILYTISSPKSPPVHNERSLESAPIVNESRRDERCGNVCFYLVTTIIGYALYSYYCARK